MTVQLSTPYTDPKAECRKAQRYRQTDRQTRVSCQEPITLRAAVRSAKNAMHQHEVNNNCTTE